MIYALIVKNSNMIASVMDMIASQYLSLYSND